MSLVSRLRGAGDEQDAESQPAGQKSIAAMLAAPFSREESKKFFQELTQEGKWHQRYLCSLWFQRLQAFREQLLRKPPESLPTVEDLVRFMSHFARCRLGEGKDGVMNYSTAQHGLVSLQKALTFRYEAWSMSARGAKLLQATCDELLREGELTREMTRSREPAGAVVVRRLVRALLQCAITTGTSNWSMMLNDIAIIVITSCFQCRAGDILGDSARPIIESEGLHGLRYADLDCVVGESGTITDIKTRVKMRNSKGKKENGRHWFYIHRNSLPDDADNVLCAIKFVLILALRSGNTYGTSLDQVLSIATARPDRTIQWRYPDRPVLCAAASIGVPDYNKLALRQRGSRTLVKATNIMRSTARMGMHSLRYGSACDLMVLGPQAARGFSLDQVGDELAHSGHAKAADSVVVYTSTYSTDDHWQQRVKLQSQQSPFDKLIKATDERILPLPPPNLASLKRKRTTKQVEQACEARGLDPNKRNNRLYHSLRPLKEPAPAIDPTLEQWKAGDEIGPQETETQPPKDATKAAQLIQDPFVALKHQMGTGQTEAARANLLQLLAQLDHTPQVPDDTANLDLVPVHGQAGETSSQYNDQDADSEEYMNLHASELSDDPDAILDGGLLLSDLGQNVAVPDTHNDAITALLAADDILEDVGTYNCEQVLLSSLVGDSAEFVGRMASVNILRLSSIKSKQWKAAQAAGTDRMTSVSAPTRFQLPCTNTCNGCDFTATEVDLLELHLCTCKYNEPPEDDTQKKKKPAKAAKSKADKQWKCDVVGCSKEYVNKGDLTAHGKEDHDEVGCFISDCDDATIYNGEKALFRNHMKDAHPALGVKHPHVQDQYIATFRCGIEGCECETDFKFFSSKSWACLSYLRHLQTAHNIMDVQERKKLVPTFPGNPCAFPGCTTEELFGVGKRGASDYDTHILMAHNVSKPMVRFEYTWQRVHAQVMPMRPE